MKSNGVKRVFPLVWRRILYAYNNTMTVEKVRHANGYYCYTVQLHWICKKGKCFTREHFAILPSLIQYQLPAVYLHILFVHGSSVRSIWPAKCWSNVRFAYSLHSSAVEEYCLVGIVIANAKSKAFNYQKPWDTSCPWFQSILAEPDLPRILAMQNTACTVAVPGNWKGLLVGVEMVG